MKTVTKTWKLGEVAQGGVITVEIKGNEIAVIGKEWDSSTGYTKSSNQSNAKEFRRKEVSADTNDAERKLDMELCELTTSYHADNILKWIKSKVKLGGVMAW